MAKPALHIAKAPSALVDFALKHNALVDLIMRMKGAGGVKVATSSASIIIDGTSVSGTGGGGTAVDVVGADGKLVAVSRHSSAVTPVTYPYELKVVTASTTSALDATGLKLTNASGKTCTIAFAGLTYDMSIREIEICDSGTTKKMLILGSAPYT